MAEFKGKDQSYVGDWLRTQNFKPSIVTAFEENEIDGDAFLALTGDMIKSLIPLLGPQAKFLSKHKQLLNGMHMGLSANDDSHGDGDHDDLSLTNGSVDDEDTSVGNQIMPSEHEDLLEDKTEGEEDNGTPPPPKILCLAATTFQLPNDKHKKSLPKPFPLPENYPPEVECGLASKTMMPSVMNRFLTTVARAIYNVKCYPTSNEYEAVAKQVITKYPFLASPAGTPYGHIEEGLKRRLKEYRRTPHSMVRAKVSAEKKNMPHEVPVEDAVSQARHIKAMRNEYAKVHKNLTIGAELMKLTFSGRRQEVQSEVQVKNLIEKYPFLQNFEEFMREFGRVVDNADVKKVAREKWEDWIPRILALGQKDHSIEQ